nr:MAG TPA: nucleoid-associated protein [Caudoviricetes sp.]
MKIIADINKVELQDFEPLISGAYRDKTIDVELSPEYDGLSVWAIFDRQSVKVEGGKCYTPTLERGTCSIGIYAVRLNNEKEIDLRYSPAPALINIEQGSYNSSLNSATAPTESEAEQIYALIDEAINAGMLKGDPGTPGKDGAPGKDGYTPIKGVDYFDGVKGDKGEKGDRGEQGVKGDRGEQGEQGIQGLPGTTVYSELTDKPIINGVTLEGDKSLSDLGVPTKISELTDDSDFVKKDEYASASQAGIIRTPVGCGISVDKDGSAHVDFPLREVTSKTDDIRVTHGSGIYILEFNSGKYAKVVDILNKQDKLSVGKGLKLENNTLTLDIPVATADTGYGG